MSVVRSSKFRHVFGSGVKLDLCFTGIKTEGSGDTNCSVSCKFIAVVKNSKIFVLPIDKPGRQEEINLPYIDCKSKVLDVAWSPFNDCVLASCEDGGDINVWMIPEDGLTETISEPFWELHAVHTRKVTTLAWHPTAEYILAATGHDTFVSIWDCENQNCLFEIPVGEMPTNVAWNRDGSRLAITTKENRAISLSIVDPRDGSVDVKNPECHQGAKPTKCVFTENGNIITIGSDRQANRSIVLWNKDDLTEIFEFELGSSCGVQNLYYDYDLHILYVHGKGESVIKYYEVDEDKEIYFLSTYQSKDSQKGGNFLPKRGVNPQTTEIARYYKLHTNKCEPISLIVPRKSEQFQADLYPPCSSEEPAMTAAEWIAGKNAFPCEKEFHRDATAGTKRQPRKISKPMAKIAPAPSSRAESKTTAESAPAGNGVPEGIDFAELLEDMKKVKATVRKLNKRVTKLEEMLEEQQDHQDGEEEEEE